MSDYAIVPVKWVLRECPEVNTEAGNPAKDRSLCPPPLPSLPSLALELGRDKTSSAFNVIILLLGNVVAHWPGVAHFSVNPPLKMASWKLLSGTIHHGGFQMEKGPPSSN
jgi:hypothetical protein